MKRWDQIKEKRIQKLNGSFNYRKAKKTRVKKDANEVPVTFIY